MLRKRLAAITTCRCRHSLAAHAMTEDKTCGFCYCKSFQQDQVIPVSWIERVPEARHLPGYSPYLRTGA